MNIWIYFCWNYLFGRFLLYSSTTDFSTWNDKIFAINIFINYGRISSILKTQSWGYL